MMAKVTYRKGVRLGLQFQGVRVLSYVRGNNSTE